MRYAVTAIVVHDEKLFAPTGDIGRWAAGVSREFERNVQWATPISTRTKSKWSMAAHPDEPAGALHAGISGSLTRTSIRQFRMDVSSSASYSTHVLFGTRRIYAKSARVPKGEPGAGQFRDVGFGEASGMYVPLRMGKGVMKQSVAGQRANNFFQTGFEMTAASHSSLRSMRFNG